MFVLNEHHCEGNNLLLNPCLEAYVCIREKIGRKAVVLFYLKSTCIVAKKDKKGLSLCRTLMVSWSLMLVVIAISWLLTDVEC